MEPFSIDDFRDFGCPLILIVEKSESVIEIDKVEHFLEMLIKATDKWSWNCKYKYVYYELNSNSARKCAVFEDINKLDYKSLVNKKTCDLTEIEQILLNDFSSKYIFRSRSKRMCFPIIVLFLIGTSSYIYEEKFLHEPHDSTRNWVRPAKKIVFTIHKIDEEESKKSIMKFARGTAESIIVCEDTNNLETIMKEILQPLEISFSLLPDSDDKEIWNDEWEDFPENKCGEYIITKKTERDTPDPDDFDAWVDEWN